MFCTELWWTFLVVPVAPCTLPARFAGPVNHFPSQTADRGWGCGWRNMQMIASYLLQRDQVCKATVTQQQLLCSRVASLLLSIDSCVQSGNANLWWVFIAHIVS